MVAALDMTHMDYMTDTNLVLAMEEEIKHTVLSVVVKRVEVIRATGMIIYPVVLILAVVRIHLCIQAAVWVVVGTYLAVVQDLTTKLFLFSRML